ncbi:MAG: DUF554 domain-containing protein [Bacillota bacterium]|nr:DUF554 domain-containing protein [Bacillota bacterium]
MIATIINSVLVLGGSLLGLLLKNRITERFSNAMTNALGLCILVIGVISAVKTEQVLCMIVSLALGTGIGEFLHIEDGLDHLGEWLRKLIERNRSGGSSFTEGFVTASLLFCVGSMAIMGSLEAGVSHNYSIILAKSIIDCITAVTFAAALGVGVAFSSLAIFFYQGTLTLLAGVLGPYLSQPVVTEMSAVGGAIIIGVAFNMLGLGEKKMHVGSMLPGIFFPIIYLPLAGLISSIF